MKNFLLMLQFFTRLPIPLELTVQEADFPRGVKYFPLVGLVIGALNALVFWLLSVVLAHHLAVLLTVLFNCLVTGALHLDGLADTCDGIFSARTKPKMLEIMKDSRIGTNGALAIFFDLALKIALLGQLKGPLLVQALVVIPVLSRTAMIVLMQTCTSARPDGGGLGNLFIGKVKNQDLVVALAVALVIAVGLLAFRAFPVFVLNLLGLLGYRWLVVAKIGGMTGDTLGALCEVSEVVSLVGLVVWAG